MSQNYTLKIVKVVNLDIYIYTYIHTYIHTYGFPGDLIGGSDSKESACNAEDLVLIPGSVRSLGEQNLEKGMATHSSILAWRIPWTEEPGGLQSMALQRVRQD